MILCGAFGSCAGLRSVELNWGLESVDSFTFVGSALEEIVLPSSLSFVGAYVFKDCK